MRMAAVRAVRDFTKYRRGSSLRRSVPCMGTMVARERRARNAGWPEVRGMSRVGPSGEFEPIAVKRESRVFVLTGAGISAESGVATFRDSGGLWYQHRVEDVATAEGFARDPRLVWRFYSERRKQVGEVKPNPAHLALAELEGFLGDGLFLVTQNVDPLHELAGSKRVLHMHGELLTSRCDTCPRPPFRGDPRPAPAVPGRPQLPRRPSRLRRMRRHHPAGRNLVRGNSARAARDRRRHRGVRSLPPRRQLGL